MTDQTPSRRAGLRDDIAAAIEAADYSGTMRRGDLADSVMTVLYREWPWLRAEADEAGLTDPEVRAQLHAVIKALGASETENKQLRAAITQVRALAGRIRQGVPWTANDDDIAAHIVAAVDGDQAPAASCSPDAAETEPNNPRTTLDNPAASGWTPPPPGDRREQLPDAILALLPERDYLSTACDTAQQLEQALRPTPTGSGVIPNVGWYVQMLHARCRRNQKFTGQLCGCGCHPHAVPDFTSPIAGRIEVREPCPWCAGTPMIARTLMDEHVARLHPEVQVLDTTGGESRPDAPTLKTAAANASRVEPDCCGAVPPADWIGDCWCTLPPGHGGEHRCQPCTDRHGAPGWTDGEGVAS